MAKTWTFRAVLYDIDETNMTVKEIWQYGQSEAERKDIYQNTKEIN